MEITYYVIKFVSDLLWQVGGFLLVLRFPPSIKLTAINNWNAVESGVKHLNPNPRPQKKWENIVFHPQLLRPWIILSKVICMFVCLMVFNATFNNISVILWWSVLLVEKTNDLPQVTYKLYVVHSKVVMTTDT